MPGARRCVPLFGGRLSAKGPASQTPTSSAEFRRAATALLVRRRCASIGTFDVSRADCQAVAHPESILFVSLLRRGSPHVRATRASSPTCFVPRRTNVHVARSGKGVRNHLRRRAGHWIVLGSAVPDTDAGTTPVRGAHRYRLPKAAAGLWIALVRRNRRVKPTTHSRGQKCEATALREEMPTIRHKSSTGRDRGRSTDFWQMARERSQAIPAS